MTKTKKKLALKRETIANLTPAQLSQVAGGAVSIYNLNTQTIYGNPGGLLNFPNVEGMTVPDGT
jgi:hypothetical protein